MDVASVEIIPVRSGKYFEPTADPVAMAGGTSGVIIVVVALLLVHAFANNNKSSVANEPENQGFEYVEARLLKQGEIKDELELPDRIVPALPTAPEEIIPLDKKEERPEPVEEPEPEVEDQADAVDDDKLRQVFDKARAFAEIQDDYVPEGHPDGVPDGDVTDPALASLGATYGRKITRYIKERWIVSTLIPESELSGLKVKINIKFNSEMTLVEYKIINESKNRLFDDSVINAIERVQQEVRHLPEPPEEVAALVFGGGLTITLHGADAPIQ